MRAIFQAWPRCALYAVLLCTIQLAACGGDSSSTSPAQTALNDKGSNPVTSISPTSTTNSVSTPVGPVPGLAAPTATPTGVPTPAAAPPVDSCNNPTYTPLSKCGTGNITIGGSNSTCQKVYLDRSTKLGTITLAQGGVLFVSDQAAQSKVQLQTNGINIQNGGTLQIGAPSCPIGKTNASDQVTVMFTGLHPSTCGDITKVGYSQCNGWIKGIEIGAGGGLFMYGLKGVPADATHTLDWTYLTQPAGPTSYNAKAGVQAPVTEANAQTIHVLGDVTANKTNSGWRANDWIAVATTSYSEWETEIVQISSLSYNSTSNITTINLTQPLKYYHFGGPDPYAGDGGVPGPASYNATAATNYGVDERAEVGLLSRNILLTSDADTVLAPRASPAGNLHWGGELRIRQDFSAFVLQGVQLQKFGKEQLGSYPIHFHMDGDLSKYTPGTNLLVDSNSVDHSYNKCVTVHSTQNLTISRNVCTRITGHIFYEEIGDEDNIAFNNNLGMGAMSNSFDVNQGADQSRAALIQQYYWIGDNMVNNTPGGPNSGPGTLPFDQFNIFDPDLQTNPTHGNCYYVGTAANGAANGQLLLLGAAGSCIPPNVYFEPPSGFWIVDPSAKLVGNAIAGCQDTGKGYWYVPPTTPQFVNNQFTPIGICAPGDANCQYKGKHGTFLNNRVSACYQGLYTDPDTVISSLMFGYQNASNTSTGGKLNQPLLDQFIGLTATRIRDRAAWLRNGFFYLDRARMADDRRDPSFVTSGGSDGNYPGGWSLEQNTVTVGESTNNVDRFGPCGAIVTVGNPAVQVRGGSWGCIDNTPGTAANPALGGEYRDRGFPDPTWNLMGFLIYDGPPLIVSDRFVNFLKDPTNLLTTADQTILKNWPAWNNSAHVYEGDAALGWLESNQSSYPTSATVKNLTFTNTDFRHQIFTEDVNLAPLNDGDQNTAIVDEGGTLSGLAVTDSKGNPIAGANPMSLNDLPINNTENTNPVNNTPSNSAEECLSLGQQNATIEGGRPTGLMSPAGIGQLEVDMLYPDPASNPFKNYTQLLTFYKDTMDFGPSQAIHGSMPLHSRNGLGVWEPKVASGYGYVVRADPYTNGGMTSLAGIPRTVDVTIQDVVMPNISSTNPYYIQLGLCYTSSAGNAHPQAGDANGGPLFTITRGYRSYGGAGFSPTDTQLASKFMQLDGNFYGVPQASLKTNVCYNLDAQIKDPDLTYCPAQGVTPATATAGCGSPKSVCPCGTIATASVNVPNNPVMCLYPKSTLTPANSLTAMTTNGAPNGPPNLNSYYYDQSTGMLYVWVRQTDPNAVGPSPLGNCQGTSSDPPYCNENTTGESYYWCPQEGCSSLRIQLNVDPSKYVPAVSSCPVFGGNGTAQSWASGTDGATWPNPPTNQNFLAAIGSAPPYQVIQTTTTTGSFPYYDYAGGTAPTCNANSP